MARTRPVKMGWPAAVMRKADDGVLYIRNPAPLPDYPRALFDRIDEWALSRPDATALADRRTGDAWRRLTYRDLRDRSRAVGEYLLAAGCSAEHGLAILAPNSIDHALMALGAMRAGIPYAPITPAYALMTSDHSRLAYVIRLMAPALVYVDERAPFIEALAHAAPDCPIVTAALPGEWSLAAALATPPGAAIAAAEAAITPDTVVKLLFTSGSTGMPKAVINTQRMLCSNQVMIRECLACLMDTPPVLVDWLPWNHTAGGNHNFGLTLYNGGSLYIDEGKPLPGKMDATIRNLAEIAPTIYFNVPKGYELLVAELERNPPLRERFFSRLQLIQYAGAGLSAHVIERLAALAVETVGEEITLITGYGATETAPFVTCPTGPMKSPGQIGLPAPGIELKLVPADNKLELRLRGPSITPGYWREPDKTAESFDEEGFYRIHDAVRLADPNDAVAGLVFDGRLAEDFKLSTGTWVDFAAIRGALIAAIAPLVREAVLTGHDRNYLGALLFLDLEQARKFDPALADADEAELAASPLLRARIQTALDELAARSSGSSNRVCRVLIQQEPASLQSGEMTDKGSVNQRAVRERRAALVEALYLEPAEASVIIAGAC